ncbi:transposase [Mesorhizobium opportunistum]|uniref:transposase n=1 Tax=Mesorhizobium opportunistum TaxID=593909 RepID=UPI0033366827
MGARSSEPCANVSVLARMIGISPSHLFGWRAAAAKTNQVERARKCLAHPDPRARSQWLAKTAIPTP